MTGERFTPLAWLGFAAAVAGVVWLVSPGVAAPAPLGAALMAVAGAAWGVYSLRGRGVGRAVARDGPQLRARAAVRRGRERAARARHSRLVARSGLSLVCGAVTSGIGYVIWYEALKGLDASRAAIVQLSVPALAALGGVLFLSEQVTWRLILCSVVILGGIALVLAQQRKPDVARSSG